jgi:hypothetical protein
MIRFIPFGIIVMVSVSKANNVDVIVESVMDHEIACVIVDLFDPGVYEFFETDKLCAGELGEPVYIPIDLAGNITLFI